MSPPQQMSPVFSLHNPPARGHYVHLNLSADTATEHYVTIAAQIDTAATVNTLPLREFRRIPDAQLEPSSASLLPYAGVMRNPSVEQIRQTKTDFS